MAIKDPPCHECKRRVVGGHSTCKEYKEWNLYQSDAKRKLNQQINPPGSRYFKNRYHGGYFRSADQSKKRYY